jgi:hypothetical protein
MLLASQAQQQQQQQLLEKHQLLFNMHKGVVCLYLQMEWLHGSISE